MIRPDRWQPADGLKLEPNALVAARETSRSLALTAGPGAGKTEMLAQRADFLLRTGTSRYPQRIMAIAFKVDAASNLKERVRRRCGPELSARLDSHTFHAFAKRLIDRFRPALTGSDALHPDYSVGSPRIQGRQIEFEDMVPLAVTILQTSNVARNAVRQTYSHVFLDEFQDCTDAQYQLICEAFRGAGIPLTAVGDTKQRIMGWAGALEGVFGTFADDFDAKTLNLYQNFRSLPRLRRMQNAMVKVMDSPAAVADEELEGPGGFVQILTYQDSQEEAESIADLVQHWIEVEELAPSEIALLVSRQPHLYADLIMAALSERNIAFRNEQDLQDLGTEPATRLIIDFLNVVVADRAPDAYGRLMSVLLAIGVDEDTAYRDRSRWHRFIDDVRQQMRDGDGQIEENTDLLRHHAEALLKLLGRHAIVALSADYERGPRLDDVIEQTFARLEDLHQHGVRAAEALSRFSEDRAVRIMTIHKSKGLEFDTTVILGVENQTFWGTRSEERAAFFVGISRAKRRLLLSVAERRPRPAQAPRRWDEYRTPLQEFLDYARLTD
ncbi:ATP-dependent helicase [Variovorax paradoxus]|uniref:ATP-dependent helicase n=1 Tax=Variovorax paradoxus TaxID=34073 RepID=UPI0029C6D1A9|nr:ATP-dependent helicase [Variovorax paradoxus]WPH18065.1 ATP-dependent helicase [Variovorax paradoxus]